ncbi:MAG TPA: M48 family metallopeptidase [Burkholderiaceae bacterium]|nr:M48 family metallopeptidase [Burkholderiaceae bacterium]
MNFFEQQELARRNSQRLIVLFVLAVAAIVLAVNVAATFVYQLFVLPVAARGFGVQLPNGFYFTNTVVVLGLVLGGTWLEMNRLKAGGAAVAAMVGARAVDPTTRDALDRRLLNVVEEMAIASGVPVPRVYVMDNEDSINAFAAGHSIDDAVVTVTRGTLTRLTRDELQGVVAHEFSHILNGDMKLNLQLIGVLFGLLIVAMAGRFLLEIGGRSRGGGDRSSGSAIVVLFAAGIVLWILGYIGVFFGRLIKAGVSRQREYLADASAVQFTRNPDGIGGALRKIAGLSQQTGLGSRINHPQAEALSHLFLGAARPTFVSGMFATHPPLEERLRRIYGHAVDALPAPENAVALALGGLSTQTEAPAAPIEYVPAGSASALAPRKLPTSSSPVAALVEGSSAAGAGGVAAQLTAEIGTVRPRRPDFDLDSSQRALLDGLRRAAADSTRAQLLVFAMLVDKERGLHDQQRALIAEAYGADAAQIVDDDHALVQQLPPGARQPLADLAMPALRRLPREAQSALLRTAHLLVAADGRVTVREFLLFSLLKRRLGPESSQRVRVRFDTLAPLAREIGIVLSLVAAVRLPDHSQRAFNAGVLQLRDIEPPFVSAVALQLDQVSSALERLNGLMPLAKPQLIKAATAVAFIDDETNWQAASTLRLICAALDAPLPPQVLQAEEG